MTIEEAIAHAKEQAEIFGETHEKFLDVAIAALEKQIPKKVKKNIMGVCCPVCKNLLDGTERFCLYCGQRIDWKVEE